MSEFDLDIEKIEFGPPPGGNDPKPKNPPRKSTGNPVGRPSKQSKLNEVRGEIESVLKLALLPVIMRDVHVVEGENGEEYYSCANVYLQMDMKLGPVLTPDGKRFVDAIADIVIDSPMMMKMLSMGDDAGNWIKLFLALQPLAMTVFHNHLAHRRS